MSIRRRILIPMVILTIVSCVAVFISAIILFNRELNNAMRSKIDVAVNVVEKEIHDLLIRAEVAALGMASNPDLINALIKNDREDIIFNANTLKTMTQIDFCNIIDKKGIVISRTHEPTRYGDDISNQPHVARALEGYRTSNLTQGAVITLGAYAGAPVFNSEMEMIGAISLGFRLDLQDFVEKMKELTGCEITIFRNDERISSTALGSDGTFALGLKATENISGVVLDGGIFYGNIELFGEDLLAHYSPLYGVGDDIVGMLCVGFFTEEDTNKVLLFTLTGALITLAVLTICLILARYISGIIERRLKSMQVKNDLQLTMLNAVIKATKIALWDMDVVTGDPVNPNNKFLWTDEFRQLMGYSSEEDFPNVLNSWSDRLHPDDKERALNAFALHMLDVTGKTPFDIEYQLLKKNNEYSYYRATGESLRDEEGNAIHVAGTLIDITDDKKNLFEIERQRMEAEVANRTKSTFLANMSHEIRTPMNSIIGFAELAQYGDIPDKTRDYLTNIQESAQWLLNIINDILDISKIESGKIDLETIPFELPDIFAHCQSAIIPKTVEKGIMLYCYAEPSIGKKLLGDPIRLRQVIMNLLSNAVKFTNAGTVKLLASVTKSDEENATIQFEIKDSGIGLSKEQIERIFEPFKQADDTITRKFGGTGLGLTITKNIIELMGGTLKVESAIGIGSRFCFELEFGLIDDESEQMIEKITVSDFEQPNFKGEILICEDNSLNQQVICDHLARVGLRTVVAYNGKEGVDAVEERIRNNKKPFDLIFMDIHMPVMDGLEAAEKIAELGAKTPIVALTANIMSNDLELYKASGMADTVGKPFTATDLWRCLVKFLTVDSYTDINPNRQAAEEAEGQKMLKTNFVKNNQETFYEFITSVENDDIKTAHRIAHTLKSNAGQINQKRLQAAAAVAEAMLSEGKNELNSEHIHDLDVELKNVLKELAPFLKETRVAAAPGDIDLEKTLKFLEELGLLLKEKDTHCIERLDEIAAIPGSEELLKHVEGFKFRQAIISLNSLKEGLVESNG